MPKLILLFCTLFFLQACSKLDLALDYAPRIAANKLDNYFDFKSERFDKVKEAIAIDLKKNKSYLKEQSLARLEELLVLANKKEISEVEIKEMFFELKKTQKDVVYAFKPTFSEIIMNMNSIEFKHLKKESEENFQNLEELLNDKEKFKKKNFDGFEKNMNSFFGSINEIQKKLYLEFVEQNYAFYKEQLEFRRLFLMGFEKLLEKKSEALEYSLKFYAGEESAKPPEFKLKQDNFFNNMITTTQKLWASLTEDQRAEFKSTLLEIKTDINNLK